MITLFSRQSTLAFAPQKAVVTASPSPGRRLRVQFEATEWFAESDKPLMINVGDWVRVIGRRNATTLLIEIDYPSSEGFPSEQFLSEQTIDNGLIFSITDNNCSG